jgi:hypothetical protein
MAAALACIPRSTVLPSTDNQNLHCSIDASYFRRPLSGCCHRTRISRAINLELCKFLRACQHLSGNGDLNLNTGLDVDDDLLDNLGGSVQTGVIR